MVSKFGLVYLKNYGSKTLFIIDPSIAKMETNFNEKPKHKLLPKT